MSTGKKRFSVSAIVIIVVFVVSMILIFAYSGKTKQDTFSALEKEVEQESQGCDTDVTAVISEISTREGEEYKSVYAPVYSFEYKGNEYNVQGKVWDTDRHYEVGQKVPIKIDSSDPTHIYDPEYNSESMITSVFLEAGIMFLVPGLVFLIIIVVIVVCVVIKLMKKARSQNE